MTRLEYLMSTREWSDLYEEVNKSFTTKHTINQATMLILVQMPDALEDLLEVLEWQQETIERLQCSVKNTK